MNIKSKQLMHELADKCKSQYVNHNGPWMDYILFAELIVKECSLYIADKGMLAGGGCTTVGEELLQIAEGLEKQFGIKE